MALNMGIQKRFPRKTLTCPASRGEILSTFAGLHVRSSFERETETAQFGQTKAFISKSLVNARLFAIKRNFH